MAELAAKYPDDLDAQVLYAEAMMDLHPWDFWTKEGEAQPWTPKILATLENVIERKPEHAMGRRRHPGDRPHAEDVGQEGGSARGGRGRTDERLRRLRV